MCLDNSLPIDTDLDSEPIYRSWNIGGYFLFLTASALIPTTDTSGSSRSPFPMESRGFVVRDELLLELDFELEKVDEILT